MSELKKVEVNTNPMDELVIVEDHLKLPQSKDGVAVYKVPKDTAKVITTTILAKHGVTYEDAIKVDKARIEVNKELYQHAGENLVSDVWGKTDEPTKVEVQYPWLNSGKIIVRTNPHDKMRTGVGSDAPVIETANQQLVFKVSTGISGDIKKSMRETLNANLKDVLNS